MRAEKRGLIFVISRAGLWWAGCGLMAGRAVVDSLASREKIVAVMGRLAGQAVVGRLAGQEKIVAVMGRVEIGDPD